MQITDERDASSRAGSIRRKYTHAREQQASRHNLTGVARERRGLDDEPPEEAEPPHPRGTGILQDEGVEEWGAWCNWEADVVGDPER